MYKTKNLNELFKDIKLQIKLYRKLVREYHILYDIKTEE